MYGELSELCGSLVQVMIPLPRTLPSVRLLEPAEWPFTLDEHDLNEDDEAQAAINPLVPATADEKSQSPSQSQPQASSVANAASAPATSASSSSSSSSASSSTTSASADSGVLPCIDAKSPADPPAMFGMALDPPICFTEPNQPKSQPRQHHHHEPELQPSASLLRATITKLGGLLDRFPYLPAEATVDDALPLSVLSFLPLLSAVINRSQTQVVQAELLDKLFTHFCTSVKAFKYEESNDVVAAEPLLEALVGVIQMGDRRAMQGCVREVYDTMIEILKKAKASGSRAVLLRLRRACIKLVVAIFYAYGEDFEVIVGVKNFFANTFPLLADPSILSHLVYVLREDEELLDRQVMPQVMRSLLAVPKKQLSVRVLRSAIDAIGHICCFVATQDGQNYLVEPYIEHIVGAMIETIENEPIALGRSCIVTLTRTIVTSWNFKPTLERWADIMAAYISLLDEDKLRERADQDAEEYEEDETDMAPQLQLCALDMLRALFTFNPLFIQRLSQKVDFPATYKRLMDTLVINIDKPVFFDDENDIRMSEALLLQVLCYYVGYAKIKKIEPFFARLRAGLAFCKSTGDQHRALVLADWSDFLHHFSVHAKDDLAAPTGI